MSFWRHREIYRSDWTRSVRERRSRRPRPHHRSDEFPAGYSSAGCSPALPASASPTDHHFAVKSSYRSTVLQRTVQSVLTVCVSLGARSTLCFIAACPLTPHLPWLHQTGTSSRIGLRPVLHFRRINNLRGVSGEVSGEPARGFSNAPIIGVKIAGLPTRCRLPAYPQGESV